MEEDIMSEQPTRMRTSDAERERVAEVLRHAMSEGRLTLAEGEQRLAAAYAVTYRSPRPKRRPRPEQRASKGCATVLNWTLGCGVPVWRRSEPRDVVGDEVPGPGQ
jgi:hypothetical protein